MNRKAPRLACLLVGAVSLAGASTIGCGGSGKSYSDARLGSDAPTDKADAMVTTPQDASSDVVTPPTPATSSKLIVAGSVHVIGSGHDTCTNQIPPSGDRWCGFVRPATLLGNSELWVVDVSKIAAGVAVKCDPTVADPNCLRLSTGLYEDPAGGFRVHGFDGDTLSYSEAPSQSGTGFLGNIFVWRPGWTAPRQLTTNNGLACSGHALTKAVVCIVNPVIDAAKTFETVELRAGFLDDQAAGPLPLVDTIILQTSTDNGAKKWGARLSPDGLSVGWSSRADVAGTENLKWQKIGDDTSRVMVASDVDQWTISADSKKWFWLKTFNFNLTGAPSGTLQAAPFPSGTAPVTLATSVGDYTEAGSTGVVYRTNVTTDMGNLLLTPDRDVPGTTAMLDTDVSFVFDITKDGKNVAYTKVISTIATNVFLFDAFVANGTGTTPCALTSMSTAFLPPTFIANGTLAAWGNFNMKTGEVEGFTTSIPGCGTKKFASDIFGWTPIPEEGIVYLDTLASDPNVNEATLRYAKVAGGSLPATGTVIQDRAGLEFATLLPSLSAVMYTITSNTTADGLYLNATLPFTVTAPVPPASDAGVDVGGGPDAGTSTDASDAGTAPEAGAGEAGAGEAGTSEAGTSEAGTSETGGDSDAGADAPSNG